jgi:hypothetical protein
MSLQVKVQQSIQSPEGIFREVHEKQAKRNIWQMNQ